MWGVMGGGIWIKVMYMVVTLCVLTQKERVSLVVCAVLCCAVLLLLWSTTSFLENTILASHHVVGPAGNRLQTSVFVRDNSPCCAFPQHCAHTGWAADQTRPSASQTSRIV